MSMSLDISVLEAHGQLPNGGRARIATIPYIFVAGTAEMGALWCNL
jgi:hypothetical protein